jgi:hypothetical protein
LTTLFLIAPTGKIPEHYIGMPKMSWPIYPYNQCAFVFIPLVAFILKNKTVFIKIIM